MDEIERIYNEVKLLYDSWIPLVQKPQLLSLEEWREFCLEFPTRLGERMYLKLEALKNEDKKNYDRIMKEKAERIMLEIRKGASAKKCCDDISNYLRGKTKLKKLLGIKAFEEAANNLTKGLIEEAKEEIRKIIPDGTNITAELKEDMLFILKQSGY